jgi:outer membrane murein-binding lipoprotein Lpp
MKTRLTHSAAALSACLASVLLAGCSGGEKSAQDQVQAAPAPAQVVAVRQPVPAQQPVPIVRPPQNVPIAVQSVSDQAAAAWATIKDYTYDQRADFLAGAGRLLGMLSSEVAELNAKRSSMPSTVETKDWDFAMKEMSDSQAYLKSMIDEASRATPDTWNQEKDKVDEAWQRTQAAFDKVKITTTS